MTEFTFHPLHLAAAVREAKATHVQLAAVPTGGGANPLDELLRVVNQTPMVEMPVLFARLRYRDLRLLCAGLGTCVDDQDAFDRLELGLRSRNCSATAKGIMALVSRSVGVPKVMQVVADVLWNEEWQAVLPTLPELPDTLDVTDPEAFIPVVATMYVESQLVWRDWVPVLSGFGMTTSVGSGLGTGSELGRRLLAYLSRHHAAEFYAREDAAMIVQWLNQLSAFVDISIAASGYLIATPADRWSDDVLEVIVQRLKDPRLHLDNWRGVPEDVRRQVEIWINRWKLSEFFLKGAGDQERFEFWLQFVDHMGPHSDGRVASGQGFFEFSGFGVIEFMEVGNAAHFYEKNTFTALRALRSPSNVALKKRDKVLRIGMQEGRLIHMGDWQWKWGRIVRRLIAQGNE